MVLKTKAVLFDLVGTLVYVKDSVGTVYSTVASSFGFDLDSYKLDNAFHLIFKSKSSPSGGNEKEKLWWKDLVFETFKTSGYDLGDKFDLVFEEIFKEFTRKSAWGIYSDVIPTFEKLKSMSIKIGLISNFDNRLEIILKEIGLVKYFDSLVYSGKIGLSKPDLGIFNYALKELNIIAEETIYIGDDINADYYPAQSLNINAYLIDRNNEININMVKKITSLGEIVDFLVV